MLASCPASILNHFSTLLGIPFRFGINSSRSSFGEALAAARSQASIRSPALPRAPGSTRRVRHSKHGAHSQAPDLPTLQVESPVWAPFCAPPSRKTLRRSNCTISPSASVTRTRYPACSRAARRAATASAVEKVSTRGRRLSGSTARSLYFPSVPSVTMAHRTSLHRRSAPAQPRYDLCGSLRPAPSSLCWRHGATGGRAAVHALEAGGRALCGCSHRRELVDQPLWLYWFLGDIAGRFIEAG